MKTFENRTHAINYYEKALLNVDLKISESKNNKPKLISLMRERAILSETLEFNRREQRKEKEKALEVL